MYHQPEPDSLSVELRRERSIRRMIKLLEAKRKRIREELEQLINHIALLVPNRSTTQSQSQSELLLDAVSRLGDEAFAELLIELMEEVKTKD